MAAGWLKLQLKSHAPTFANVKAFFLMKTERFNSKLFGFPDTCSKEKLR